MFFWREKRKKKRRELEEEQVLKVLKEKLHKHNLQCNSSGLKIESRQAVGDDGVRYDVTVPVSPIGGRQTRRSFEIILKSGRGKAAFRKP